MKIQIMLDDLQLMWENAPSEPLTPDFVVEAALRLANTIFRDCWHEIPGAHPNVEMAVGDIQVRVMLTADEQEHFGRGQFVDIDSQTGKIH